MHSRLKPSSSATGRANTMVPRLPKFWRIRAGPAMMMSLMPTPLVMLILAISSVMPMEIRELAVLDCFSLRNLAGLKRYSARQRIMA